MTEELEVVDQDSIPAEEAQTTEPRQEEAAAPLSRDIVSKIVERERRKAFEKGKQEGRMELQQQAQQAQPEQQAPQMQQQGQVGLGGMQQFSPADLQKMLAEHIPQALQEHVANLKNEQVVNSFVSKMQAAEQKYPGLEEKLNDLDYRTLAPIVTMANDMENTADIMKELVDNPMKMGTLLTLMQNQPRMAQKAMADLSNSIKQNQDALAQEKQAQDPMSQLKPSTSAGMDNGAMSVSDYRKMFR